MTETPDAGMTDVEIVKALRELLGARLTALVAGVGETRTIRVWADGAEAPPTEVMARLRLAYRVAGELAREESPEVAQAWFMGRNPNLSDRSPAQLLRDGDPEAGDEVIGAARQFLGESGASEVAQQEDTDGGSERVRKGGWQSAEEASAYYASIGPWVTAAAVIKYCDISEQTLESWRESRLVLGVEFADGQFYYQQQQFVDEQPLPGLDRVLDVLAPAFRSPGSQAGWFAAKAYYGDSTTRWDVLRAGEVQLLVGWGEEDAGRVLGP
ncbi:MAG: hypothetical protein WED09_13825 [Homoserinimonas sp.]